MQTTPTVSDAGSSASRALSLARFAVYRACLSCASSSVRGSQHILCVWCGDTGKARVITHAVASVWRTCHEARSRFETQAMLDGVGVSPRARKKAAAGEDEGETCQRTSRRPAPSGRLPVPGS